MIMAMKDEEIDIVIEVIKLRRPEVFNKEELNNANKE